MTAVSSLHNAARCAGLCKNALCGQRDYSAHLAHCARVCPGARSLRLLRAPVLPFNDDKLIGRAQKIVPP